MREPLRPLVALTTEMVAQAGRHRKPQATLYGAYVDRLQEVGLTPVLITPLHDEASIRQILASCAGIVLSGGEDVDPARYGEEAIPDRTFVTPERDVAEWIALDEALGRHLPILAICRGIQVLNAHQGGTLWQDIPSQKPDAMVHEQTAPWGSPSHTVEVTPGSRLHAILGGNRLEVNSWHHQAPKTVAPGYAVTVRSEDGVIEGIETTGPDFIVGVQWHPERLSGAAPANHHDRRLFRAFAEAVRARTAEVAA